MISIISELCSFEVAMCNIFVEKYKSFSEHAQCHCSNTIKIASYLSIKIFTFYDSYPSVASVVYSNEKIL